MQRIALGAAALAVGLAIVLVSSTPAEAQDVQATRKEMAEILSKLAQTELLFPFKQAPMPCLAPWVTGRSDNFVRHVAPIGQKAGLQAGDTLKRIGTQTLPGAEPYEWQPAMLRLPQGLTSYYVEVSRAGKSIVITMPCEPRVASQLFDAEFRLLTALTQRNWYACIDAGLTIIDTFGAPVSSTFRTMDSCATVAGDIDDKELADYVFGYALGLTQEIRALVPRPDEMRDEILARLKQLDALHASTGVDHATKLRAAMNSIGLTPP